MSKTIKEIKDLFKNSDAIGLDEDSSSVLIGNINQTTMPMCVGTDLTPEENDTDDFTVIFFMVDASSSMENVENVVTESFDDIIIPGLIGGALDQVGGIRVGGILFGSDIKPLWGGGFHPVKELPKLKGQYRPYGMTCLNQACLDGVTAATAYSLELYEETGTMPQTIIVALSDGANNIPPLDNSKIKEVYEKLSPELVTTVFLGFETWEPVDFRTIAKELGFRDVDVTEMKPGEAKEDVEKRMRNKMKIFSDNLIGRASKSKIGTQPDQSGNTGFWDEDDE